MIRFTAVAFVLASATSAQAMSPAPLHQPDGMTTQARQLRNPPVRLERPRSRTRWGCPRCGANGICMLRVPPLDPPPGQPQVLRIRLRYRTEPGGHNSGVLAKFNRPGAPGPRLFPCLVRSLALSEEKKNA